MGITGLLPFLDASSRQCNISEFSGCTVAIDTYCWLHKGAFACADRIVSGRPTNIYINYCLKYVELLKSHNIKPILVFDGQRLPAKKHTETKRRDRRKDALAKGMTLFQLGEVDKARHYFQQCVDITHKMALNLIIQCRLLKIDYIVAPYEADAQLAFLNMQGIADLVITEDSDLILFGCSKILFKFKSDGSGILIEKSKLNKSMKMRPDQYSFEKFRYMCIMSGCDYLDSLPGIGIARAHKAISMTHNPNIYHLLPRLPRYLNLSKLVVSDEYIENFKLADATIQHQIVYDPLQRKLKPLIDPSETNTDPKYLVNAGSISNSAIAFQMALGNIDPISYEVLSCWNPDEDPAVNNSSIWCQAYKKCSFLTKSKSPNPKPKSTKNIAVKMPTERLLVVEQDCNSGYDEKLKEELRVYKDVEHEPKRTKTDKECGTKIKMSTERHSNNPFVKKKSPKLSKFQATTLDKSNVVTSRFFNLNLKKVYKLVEVPLDPFCVNKNDDNCSTSNQLVCFYGSTENKPHDISDKSGSEDNSEQFSLHYSTSPILSRTQRGTEHLKRSTRDRNKKTCTFDDTSESSQNEIISVSDEVISVHSTNKQVDDFSDLLGKVQNGNTLKQQSSETRFTQHLNAFKREKIKRSFSHDNTPKSSQTEVIVLSDEVESIQSKIVNNDASGLCVKVHKDESDSSVYDASTEKLSVQDEVISIASSVQEFDFDSFDLLDDNTQKTPPGDELLNNTHFIQRKSRKKGIVKKSNQPTLTSMFRKLSEQ